MAISFLSVFLHFIHKCVNKFSTQIEKAREIIVKINTHSYEHMDGIPQTQMILHLEYKPRHLGVSEENRIMVGNAHTSTDTNQNL